MARARRPSLGPWHWSALAVAVAWSLAVVVLACRLIGGTWLLARIKKQGCAVDEALYGLFEECRRAIPLSRRLVLAAHSAVGSPLTVGGRCPTILVPDDWCAWSEAERRVCLLHELTHLARHDDWLKFVQELIRIPFFFHPLLHALMARIDRDRELLCDEAAVALGADPLAYARLLLELRGIPADCCRSPRFWLRDMCDFSTVAR